MANRFVLLMSALLLLGGTSGARAVELDQYPELVTFIEEMVEQHRFEAPALKRLFERARMQPAIVAAMERPKEALPWYEYKRLFLTPQRIDLGRTYQHRHRRALARAEQKYGVPAEIIVAIIGVETLYGRNQGDYLVIDALTTLALTYPRRADFFRRELKEYLLLARELKIDPLRVKGSYAGAIGIPQFIPSSYRRYAVDFDGDRKANLLTSAEDTIGSVAHYLSAHGWETKEPILDDLELDGPLHLWLEKLGPKPTLNVRHLIGYGIFPRAMAKGPPGDKPQGETQMTETLTPSETDALVNASERYAALIVLEDESGPVGRIGYHNFYVITRYNHSKRYAMAVYELGRMIRANDSQS